MSERLVGEQRGSHSEEDLAAGRESLCWWGTVNCLWRDHMGRNVGSLQELRAAGWRPARTWKPSFCNHKESKAATTQMGLEDFLPGAFSVRPGAEEPTMRARLLSYRNMRAQMGVVCDYLLHSNGKLIQYTWLLLGLQIPHLCWLQRDERPEKMNFRIIEMWYSFNYF